MHLLPICHSRFSFFLLQSRACRPRTCLNFAPDIEQIFLNIENVFLKGQVVRIIAEGLLDFYRHMLLRESCITAVSH